MKTYFSLGLLFLFLNQGFANAGTNPGDPDTTSVSTAPVNPLAVRRAPISLKGIGKTKESKYKRWSKLKYSGYIRSFVQYRHMPVRYAEAPEINLLTINGLDVRSGGTVFTGYQEPLFLLRLEGAPTSKTMFKVETLFDNQMFGIIKENTSLMGSGTGSNANRRLYVYRIFEFTGKANTKIGNFKLISGGGVIWKRLSPFTYWNYEYRDDMFERYPWEPEGSPWSRYNQFYALQNISRDARWGNTGTQGFVLEATGLPLGFSGDFIYGKTDNSGGFQTYLSRTPKNVIAGRLARSFGKHQLSVNYFNQFGFSDGYSHHLYYSDSLPKLSATSDANYDKYLTTSMLRTRQQILTAEGRLNLGGIKIYTEAGIGRYQDSLLRELSGHNDSVNAILENQINLPKSGNYYVNGLNYDWGHAFNIQIDFDRSLTKIPLGLQFFSITKSVVNVNSQVMNSSNTHALSDLKNIGKASDITTFPGVITEIYNAQMTNNRWGARLRHEDSYRKLKVMFAMDMQQEHENLFNVVTFQHQLNAFTRSRFGYFQQFVGPYQRIVNIFRRSFEKVNITDPVVDYKKGFNSVALNLKYKFMLLNKELIVSSFTNYNSVQDKLSPIPVFSDDAFIRTFFEEFLAFYAIHPRLTLLGMAGVERNIGNNRTEVVDASGELIKNSATGAEIADPNGKPLNQYGYGYGLGFDYDLTGRAGLFFRHRWFHFQDVNQIKDRFHGSETSIELKIFF